MNGSNKVRIWLCDCGRIHLETKHYRVSLLPAEFVRSLQRAAGEGSTRGLEPQQISYLDEACMETPASRAAQRQPARY